MFEFLYQKYNSRMEFDPNHPTVDMSDFKECKWKYFYGETK